MHYLGLAGMPRRIMDYPLAYEWYNWIATSGSITSLMSVAVFIWVFFDAFHHNNFCFKDINVFAKNPVDIDFIHKEFFFVHYSNFGEKVGRAFMHDLRALVYYSARLFWVLHNADRRAFRALTAAPVDAARAPAAWLYAHTFVAIALFWKERAPYEIDHINAAPYASRYFQQPATEVMSNIIDFHNDLMVVLIFISIFIFVLLSACLYNYSTTSLNDFYLSRLPVSRMTHEPFVEVAFTVVPAFIVYSIAAPSFALLYANNDWLERDTDLTVSITGHQWYWGYEYSLDKLYFDSEEA